MEVTADRTCSASCRTASTPANGPAVLVVVLYLLCRLMSAITLDAAVTNFSTAVAVALVSRVTDTFTAVAVSASAVRVTPGSTSVNTLPLAVTE